MDYFGWSEKLIILSGEFPFQPTHYFRSFTNHILLNYSDEPDAEERCHQALNEAFKEDKDNIEAHQSMANLRLVRNNTQEAKKHLTVVF